MPAIMLAVLIVILDQWSKFYVVNHMAPGTSIPIVPEVFHLTLVFNPGAAFGILEHKTGFFIFIAIVMLIVITYFLMHIPRRCIMLRTGVTMMAGGAVGNVIDRIRAGYVVDFFDFRIWPVFNVADIAICTGAACIIYASFRVANKEDGTLE